MPTLIPIQKVTRVDLLDVIRKSLHAELSAEVIDDFVASVDWSHATGAPSPMAEVIGALEGWASEYADGELPRGEYITRLLSLLPASERERLPIVGGRTVVTAPAPDRAPEPERRGLAARPPQSESFPHYRWGAIAAGSSTGPSR